jgi:sporulation protein YlmC with PRC-barrel domain
MKRHLGIVLVALVSLVLGTNGFAQESQGSARGAMRSNPAADPRINAFMVDRVIGSKVMNLQGEPLGKIADLVVDVDTGRILYAILESGGFLGIGEKLFPVPWASLGALPLEGTFFLNQNKAQMDKAPAFDKKNLPDLGDMQWGEGILRHYGVLGYEQGGPMGYDYGYGGYSMYPGPREREDPYRTVFDAKTIQTITGQVIKIERLRATRVGMEMRLTVLIDKKEVLPVYLGPPWYIEVPGQPAHFLLGDTVTVSGSHATRGGESFLIAMTVTHGKDVLLLRDKDGNPEWVGWKPWKTTSK